MSLDHTNKGTRVLYKGPSMKPFLKDLDLLFIEPFKEGTVALGDVVLFDAPDTGDPVVHRVVSITNGEIRTQGDHNREMDPFFLGRTDIMGKVVLADRGGRLIRVTGGKRGFMMHRLVQILWLLSMKGRQIVAPLFHFFVFFKPLRWTRFFLPKLHLRLFKKGQEEDQVLMSGRFIVGRRKAPGGQWKINRFYRLVFSLDDLVDKGDK